MDAVKVRFLSTRIFNNALRVGGDVVDVPVNDAAQFVRQGIAEYVKADEEKFAKKKIRNEKDVETDVGIATFENV